MIAPRLIAITDSMACGWPVVVDAMTALTSAAAPESVLVLLRFPGLPAREALAAGRALRSRTRRTRQWLSVADRIDVALLLEADGLHLGEQSVATVDARRLFRGFVSRAAHTVAAAARTLDDGGADAVLLSPIVAPRKGAPALGISALSSVRQARAQPSSGGRLYALGGVSSATARACLAAGADGVAAVAAARDEPAALLAALGA